MSKLRFSKQAVEQMALLLLTDVEPQEIAQTFHFHFTTVYQIKQNINVFEETQPVMSVIMNRS